MNKTNKKLIAKIRGNKRTGQKYVTIPQEYKDLEIGDYVRVIKEASE